MRKQIAALVPAFAVGTVALCALVTLSSMAERVADSPALAQLLGNAAIPFALVVAAVWLFIPESDDFPPDDLGDPRP